MSRRLRGRGKVSTNHRPLKTQERRRGHDNNARIRGTANIVLSFILAVNVHPQSDQVITTLRTAGLQQFREHCSLSSRTLMVSKLQVLAELLVEILVAILAILYDALFHELLDDPQYLGLSLSHTRDVQRDPPISRRPYPCDLITPQWNPVPKD